uniref:Uncharacterized protein n=1 Tax=Brassica campestris TaxID=3711 RepID=M4E8N0_BRACM|nr:unnamed protein product [Brassica rapa]
MANNHQLLQTFVHSSPGEKIPSSLRKLLSRTNEASLSAVISRLEHERQGLTDGGGERWRRTVVENGGIRRRISAGAIRKPKRCLYGPGELETEVSGSSSRFVVGFLCNRASVVSVFPCEEGCCVDELWRLDNALRSRFGKTEQRHRGHFTFKHSHWSMHSTWKLWAQALQLAQRHQMQLKQRKDSDRPLYQLQLMSKVKNIASLQLYGEEQASGSSQCQYE